GAGVRNVDVIVEPDDGVRMITRPIRDATRSIWLTMYLLTNRTIIHDLEYAHASGVQVRVILEPHPYGTLSNANRYAYNNLLAADIPVHWVSPADARPLLTALIRSAQHTLDVYAEELQDTGMGRARAATARRGVRVRVILPAPSRPDRDAPGVARIRAAGAQVHRLRQSYLY